MSKPSSILFQIWYYIAQILVISLLDFAISGVIIFMLHGFHISPINPDEPGVFNALIYTLFTGSLDCLMINLYIHYSRSTNDAQSLGNYLRLSLVILLGQYLIDPLELSLNLQYHWDDLYTFHPFEIFFYSNHILVGSLLYTYLVKEQKRIRKISEQEYQLLILKELKTKAELEALQAKINPHFLYNALNSIASLVHIDPDKAEKMVLLLSKFFRYSTSVKNEYFNTLRGEVEMVQTYLEVEKVRFDERLEYEITFSEEELKEYQSPRFLIQPLVENAIKHGISKIEENGFIEIKIYLKDDDHVEIIIHDNGQAFPENIHPGYGLQSTQDKIRIFYGDKARLEIKNGNYKHIKITLPADKDLKASSRNLIKISVD